MRNSTSKKKKKSLKGKSSTGAKKDSIGAHNKPRLSLIPKSALWALGGALTHGEVRYGTNNWRKGLPVTFLCDSAIRHILQFLDGENIDKQSQNPHLGNAMANLSMAIEMIESIPEMDDRYTNEVHSKSRTVRKTKRKGTTTNSRRT